jgi:outer membrane beta-barrel protein
VLKKGHDAGFNGGVNLGYNQGFYGRTNDVVSFNYRQHHSNLFGNFGYSLDQNYSNGRFSRYFSNPDGSLNSSTLQTSDYHYRSNGWNGRLGMDFFVSPQTTLGFMVNGSARPKTDLLTYSNRQLDSTGALDSSAQGYTSGSYTWRNLAVNGNAAHSFKRSGARLTADLDWVGFYSRGDQNSPLNDYLPDGSLAGGQDRLFLSPGTVDIYSAKTDYVLPLRGQAEFSAGLKTSQVHTDNQLDWFDADSGKAVPDYGQSNHFAYTETIDAGYASLRKQGKRWGLQVGLRAENTHSSGHQFLNPAVPDSAFHFQYTNLFPSAYLACKLDSSGHQTLVLSATRKIRRPGYPQLNPFLFYQDQYTYTAGNPTLKPYYVDYVELKYMYKQNLGLTAGYWQGNNEIQSLTQAVGEVFITRPQNYIRNRAFSLVPFVAVDPARWWSFRLNAVFLFQRNTGSAGEVTVNQNANIHEVEVSNEFRISDGWSAELDGFFPGKQTFAQSQSDKALYNISVGIRRSILHGQGTLNLTFNDLLGTFSKSVSQTIDVPQVTAFTMRATDARRIGVAFSYRFGKSANARKVRHDQGGAEDEQDRTK